jgi:hypothetical protein
VHWGASPSSLTHSANSTSFEFATIGWMHQALMDFAGVVPEGAHGYYSVEVAGVASAVFDIVPSVTGVERHVVFGDFGLANDVSMAALVADAAAGAFDSVLHVGDWAYNFEQDTGCGATSCVGNSFMNKIQGCASLPARVTAAPYSEKPRAHPSVWPPPCVRHPHRRGHQAHHARRWQPRGVPDVPGQRGRPRLGRQLQRVPRPHAQRRAAQQQRQQHLLQL